MKRKICSCRQTSCFSILFQEFIFLALMKIQEIFKAVTFDEGALIHCLQWPKYSKIETVCETYVDLVTCFSPRNTLKLLYFIIMKLLQQKTVRRNVVVCNRITQLMSVLHPIFQFLVIRVLSYQISVTSSPSSWKSARKKLHYRCSC